MFEADRGRSEDKFLSMAKKEFFKKFFKNF